MSGSAIPPRSASYNAATGSIIDWRKGKVFNDWDNPTSATLTNDFEGARLRQIQIIYHNAGSWVEPANWVKLGDVDYAASQLNIVYAEYCADDRVEYWFTQES